MKFNKIGIYLPEKIYTNQNLVQDFPEWSIEKIGNKIGINQRHISTESETTLVLAQKACVNLFDEFDIEKAHINFILFCTQSPDYILPTTACLLQDELKLNTNIGALDFNLGCSGFIYGLALAKSLIMSKISSAVLLVTSETYSKWIHESDKGNRSIFGDAATAMLLTESDISNVGEFILGTDGSGGGNLVVRNSGLKREIIENPMHDGFLYMDGPEIFNFTVEVVPELVQNVLNANNLDLTQIDYFIFHQANKYILEYLREKLSIPAEKFYIDMVDCGNTVSSTIPIALKRCLDMNFIKNGDKVLLVGFGVGYSYGGTVITI